MKYLKIRTPPEVVRRGQETFIASDGERIHFFKGFHVKWIDGKPMLHQVGDI